MTANWTNPDCFAVVPLCGVFLAGALLGRTSGAARVLPALGGGFLLVTLVLTWSRSAWVGLACGLVALGVQAGRNSSSRLRESLFYAVCGLIPVTTFLYFSGSWRIVAQRWTQAWASRTDLPVRQEIWWGSWEAFLKKPVSGGGPGTFSLIFQQHRPVDTLTTEYMNVAHNDSLQMLVECGLPGLVLWLFLLFLAVRTCFRCREPGWRSGAVWVGAGIVAVFFFSLFNFTLPVAADIVWWFALLGVAFALPSEETSLGDYRHSLGLAVSVVMVLAGTLTVFYSARIGLAQRARSVAHRQVADMKLQEAYDALGRAIRLEPDRVSHFYERAGLCRSLYTLTGEEVWLEQAFADLEKARSISPRNLPVLSASYRLFLSSGRFVEAREVVNEARVFAPYDQRFVRHLAGLQALEQDLGAAVETLLKESGSKEGREIVPLLHTLCLKEPARFKELMSRLEKEKGMALCDLVLEKAELQGHKEVVDTIYRWELSRVSEEERVPLLLRWSTSLEVLNQKEASLKILESGLGAAGPEHPLYGELLSRWALHQGAKAVEDLRNYLKSHPESSPVRATLARKLSAEQAVVLLEEGLREWPGDPALLEALGDTYERNGLTQIARDYYRQALERGGDKEIIERKLKE
jgi:Flp pilus assembly protein TadD